MGLPRMGDSSDSGDLATEELDGIEGDLDKLGTPPDNYFRRMIREIRRRRADSGAVVIKDEDLEIVSGCAAAHPDRRGGQHVAKTCTGVLIVHKPTGIAVRMLDERSQYKNKQNALAKLRELLS